MENPTQSALEMAKLLDSLQSRITALELARSLKHASIDGGSIPAYDRDGNLQLTMGIQPDGTFGVVTYNSVPPPMPAAPTLRDTYGGITVAHFGTTWDGSEWPMDISHIEIHLDSLETFSPYDSTQVGTFTNMRGGLFPVMNLDPAIKYWVRLIAVNTSGTESAPTPAVGLNPGSAVSQEDLDTLDQGLEDAVSDLEDAIGTRSGVFYNNVTAGDTVPAAVRVGDTWFKPDQDYKAFKWDGDSWESFSFGADALSNAVTTAIQNAQLAADAAAEDSADAMLEALAAQTAAGNAQGDATTAIGGATAAAAAALAAQQAADAAIYDSADAMREAQAAASDATTAIGNAAAAAAAALAAQQSADQLDIDLTAVVTDVTVVEQKIAEVEVTTIPGLQADIDAAAARVAATEGDLTTLHDTTLPALQNELDANEAAVATIQEIALPALSDDLAAAEGRLDAAELDVNALQGEMTAAQTDLTTLHTTTLPALQDDLAAAQDRITSEAARLDTDLLELAGDLADLTTNTSQSIGSVSDLVTIINGATKTRHGIY